MKQLPIKSTEFKQTLAGFAGWLAVLGYSRSSRAGLPAHLRETLHWCEGEGLRSLTAITPLHLQRFFEYLKQRPNRRRVGSLSAGHLNKYVQALTLWSRYLAQTGGPAVQVTLDYLEPPDRLPVVLTEAEIGRLYAACAPDAYGLRDRAMLGIYYG